MKIFLSIFFITTTFFFAQSANAAINQVSSNGAASNNSNGWTNPSNAHGTSDDNTYATATPPLGGSVSGDWGTYNFDSLIPENAEIISVEVIPQYKENVLLLGASSLSVQAVVNGTACPGSPITDSSEPTTDTEFVADVTSCRSWTRNDLLNASFETRIAANRSLLGLLLNSFDLDYVRVQVTYDTPETTQSAYRFFQNNNSTDVGSPLATQDTAANLSSYAEEFRLRILIHSSDAATPTSDQFKLQYVDKGNGTCAAPSGGTPSIYTDVTSSTLIAFNDNGTPADNATVTTNANDPSHSGHTNTTESYNEANPATVNTGIADGNDGLFDFSLIDNGASGATSYCFRLVHSDGTALSSYDQYPEITPEGILVVDIVDASGNTVNSPSVNFSASQLGFGCDTPTATLGVTAEKLRILNDTDNPAWSISIAATSGPSALWTTGLDHYDFNDSSGCSDSGDTDSFGGQLTINPGTATISPETSCSSSNISAATQNSFEEGITNSILLFSANSSADIGCYWDIEGITLQQQIPQEQNTGSYSIDLTVTALAL